MTSRIHRKAAWAIAALLFSTLACRAATRLVYPDTPTPRPPATVTPFAPATSTVPVEASCPVITTDIINRAASFESGLDEELDEEIYLVIYPVEGDALSDPVFEDAPGDFLDEQNDIDSHIAIWQLFTRLIPADRRGFVSEFAIITDGGDNVLAAVVQDSSDPEAWVLEVDILDSTDTHALTFTLLHEFAHLLTLNATQVSPSRAIYNNPTNDEIYQRELAACPQYFPGEGCSLPESYINRFFDRFWFDLYAEWQEIDEEPDDDTRYDLLDEFYITYQDQFLTDYASASPEEDIAESFAYFLLSPRPQPVSIAEEKILFFYEFPELVQLRGEILRQLCLEFPS